MATSGVANFSLTRNELLTSVLEVMQVIAPGDTANAGDITTLARALNMMVKAWHTLGLNIWTWQRISLPLTAGKRSYTLGPLGGGVEDFTIEDGGDGYSSAPTVTISGGTTAVAVVSGGSVVSVTPTAPGSAHIVRPTVSFTGGGGSGAVATANLFGVFTTRPLKIVTAQTRSVLTENDVDMFHFARKTYDALGNKASTGVPVNYYYDPQLDNGVLYVYPTANSSTSHTIELTVQRPLYDINLATENADFPQEWYLALQWGLAHEVSSRFGLPESMMGYIKAQADMYREAMSDFDGLQENASIQFAPNLDGMESW